MKLQTRATPDQDKLQIFAKIREDLIKWSAQNPRNLPWKGTKDPYKIWVSEIILQQTRVNQGTAYYHRFLEAFPTVYSLAEASLDEIMKVWEGLGYYRRATHMHETARALVRDHQGKFPQSHDEILQLKGVGPYTAAAISSFAFGLPHPVLDGNVMRVISRLFNLHEPINSRSGKKQLKALSEHILDLRRPGQFNQAIMDFGALVCTPRNPDCSNCPLFRHCLAMQNKTVQHLPVKKRLKHKKKRHFYYLKINQGPDTFIRRRSKADIWQNLYEFYLIEGPSRLSWKDILRESNFEMDVTAYSEVYTQILSHQEITARFAEVTLSSPSSFLVEQGYVKVNQKKLRTFAYPKIIDCYLGDKALNLD